ncbi:anti-sigma factor [Finegoldia magna]|uniref:ATP-binding protein n=1 Tax=Finegoldia TaxID=150022 RepID=UPI0027BAFFA4|nr:anti-sigma factor [Finegoldia magna]MDU7559919.1 anti-sigma factor [Finegoldia magna]
MEEFRLSFQNEKENVSLIRLSSSFIAMKCGFSVDDIEDIKLCASECLNLQRNRSKIIDCTMTIDDESLTLIFKLDGFNPRENNEKDKISEMIIQSLMDEYEINGSEIKVIKNRK